MNKYLILIKHSVPEVVENTPAREWHLSEDGKLRAERLAKRLIAYQPEVLFSSVEPKAKETAEMIAALHNLHVHFAENLREHDRSNAPYLSKAEFQNAVREFFANPEMLMFGNETANQSYDRFSKAIHALLEAHKDRTIAVVSHGTVISLFISHLFNTSGYFLWKELGLPSFIVLDMNSNTLIEQENIL